MCLVLLHTFLKYRDHYTSNIIVAALHATCMYMYMCVVYKRVSLETTHIPWYSHVHDVHTCIYMIVGMQELTLPAYSLSYL